MIEVKLGDKVSTFFTFSDLILGEFFISDGRVYIKCSKDEAIDIQRHMKFVFDDDEVLDDKIVLNFTCDTEE